MYLKVASTLLLALAAVIAFRLWRPPPGGPVVPMAAGQPAAHGVWPDDPLPLDPVLDRRVPRLVIAADRIDEALRQFRQQAGVNVVWSEGTLPVMSGDPIRLDLRDATVGEAMRRLLGLGAHPPPVSARDGMVLLAPAEPFVLLYNVRGILGPASRDRADVVVQNGEPGETRADRLVRTVEAYVRNGGWDNGGYGDAGVTEFDGILIINTSAENHRAIIRLLETLRSGGPPPGGPTTKP